ncbi:hypothetical protein [uncultured Psychroserpens sp.]|uniref:hypothetical protein n=1 Tax=uncultured Psychroserpens sp. TaxID=255436 RepID=UPI00262CF0D9|nr:hypothetical protein [uncultured Psychroserpens sp.]
MKIIYYINKFVLITTLALYFTLFLGLYAQIVLGIVQVISSFLLVFIWEKIKANTKERLFIYWALISTYGTCWLFDWKNFNQDILVIFGIIIIPISIAIYFFYILKTTKNHLS